MDTKINGLKNFSNISSVNKIAQNNKQNRLKQSYLSYLLFILFNLIIYTTEKSQVLKPFIFVSSLSLCPPMYILVGQHSVYLVKRHQHTNIIFY